MLDAMPLMITDAMPPRYAIASAPFRCAIFATTRRCCFRRRCLFDIAAEALIFAMFSLDYAMLPLREQAVAI